MDGQAIVTRDKPQPGSGLPSSQYEKRDYTVLIAGKKINQFLKESKAFPSTSLSLGDSFRGHWVLRSLMTESSVSKGVSCESSG